MIYKKNSYLILLFAILVLSFFLTTENAMAGPIMCPPPDSTKNCGYTADLNFSFFCDMYGPDIWNGNRILGGQRCSNGGDGGGYYMIGTGEPNRSTLTYPFASSTPPGWSYNKYFDPYGVWSGGAIPAGEFPDPSGYYIYRFFGGFVQVIHTISDDESWVGVGSNTGYWTGCNHDNFRSVYHSSCPASTYVQNGVYGASNNYTIQAQPGDGLSFYAQNDLRPNGTGPWGGGSISISLKNATVCYTEKYKKTFGGYEDKQTYYPVADGRCEPLSPPPPPPPPPMPLPTATLTANGGTSITVNVGDSINYSWSSTNGTNWTSSYTAINQGDSCPGGVAYAGEVKPWIANSAQGSLSATTDPCQAGVTYAITYQVSNSSGTATAVINVTVVDGSSSPPPPPPSPPPEETITPEPSFPPTAFLTANNRHQVSVNVGDIIQYYWSSTNGTSWSSLYTADGADSCDDGITFAGEVKPWIANSAQGSNFRYVDSCQAGRTYYISYNVSNSLGEAFDTISVTVGPASTLSVNFSATPNSGSSPLYSNLSALVGGTATGTINYNFWWNCPDTSNSVSVAESVCGFLPSPGWGSCESNENGYKCLAVNTNPQSVAHSYSSGSTAKVIVERNSAVPAEARVPITIVSNAPPTVSNVTATEPDYCVSGPSAFVSWTYSDPNGDPQSAYQVQIDDTGSAWNLPVYDSGKVLTSGTATYLSGLLFNTTYKARVRVWDSQDLASNWVEMSICNGPGCLGNGNSWKTPKHSYPLVDFSWSPFNPNAGQPVQFTDLTQFFDGGGTSQRVWNWLFNAPNPSPSSTAQNPTHTYASAGGYNVSETVTDRDGYTCQRTKPVNVQRAIPIWREVSPK